MTADDNHYPGPDVGTIVAGLVTVALIGLIAGAFVAAIAAVVEALT